VAVGHAVLLHYAMQHCASGPHTEAGPLALNYFFKIFQFNSNFANFKNLHKIHLKSENYETNFAG
jgi:hypothetical protein